MSDTPETDAVEAWPASNLKLGNIGVVPSEFARRLERERDEARDQSQRLRVQLNHYSQVNELAEEAFRERDAAREIAEEADAAHDMAIADLARCEKSVDTLVQRATELIGRWDSPSWKEAGPTARFVEKLREAVAAYKGHSRSEAPKKPCPLPPIDARYSVVKKAPKRKKRKAKAIRQ